VDTSAFAYRAFISYSHRDERWAAWLHRALERYRVPRRLVGRNTANGVVPARIAPIFRDREELATATDLGRVVNEALERSSSLIVICSPAAAQSRWVDKEIRAFQKLGRGDRIFCLIVDGEPNGAADRQCFPDALLRRSDSADPAGAMPAVEPIGADVRAGNDSRRSALLKLIAGLLGVGLDELARRDLQRRNRRLVMVSAAAVAGMAVTSALAVLALTARNEAERQRARAEVEATTARQTSEFLVEIFQVADPSEARGNTITAREILDRGATRIDRDLTAQPVVRANLLQTMGRVYTGLGLYAPATDLLSRAASLREQIQPGTTPEAVATANALGAALYLKGEYEAAEQAYATALEGARALYPNGDPQLTEAMNGAADLLTQRGEFAAAEAEYAAALEIDKRLHGDKHADVARSLTGLASALLYQDRFEESEAAYREGLAIQRETLGEDHPVTVVTMSNLGALLYFSGQMEAAEQVYFDAIELCRRVFGSEHLETATLINNVGRLLLERGKVADAERLLEEGLATERKLKDPGHDDFVYSLNNLGLAELGLGKVDVALALLREAREVGEAHRHRMLGQVWGNLAEAYWRTGAGAQALEAAAAARPLLEADQPDETWHGANLDGIETSVRVSMGNLAGAESALLDSYGAIAERWGDSSVFSQLAAGRLAKFYEASGNADLMRQYRERASSR
jgi:tetratricopeptide (TPR) repeat protein